MTLTKKDIVANREEFLGDIARNLHIDVTEVSEEIVDDIRGYATSTEGEFKYICEPSKYTEGELTVPSEVDKWIKEAKLALVEEEELDEDEEEEESFALAHADDSLLAVVLKDGIGGPKFDRLLTIDILPYVKDHPVKFMRSLYMPYKVAEEEKFYVIDTDATDSLKEHYPDYKSFLSRGPLGTLRHTIMEIEEDGTVLTGYDSGKSYDIKNTRQKEFLFTREEITRLKGTYTYVPFGDKF